MMRTAAMCAVALATLCTLSPSAGATTVPPGRIVSLIPSDDEVSQYVGVPVTHAADLIPIRPSGPVHLDQRDECRSLAYDDTVEVWGSDYTAFRAQAWTHQPDPSRMFVTEAVGTFVNTAGARDRFNAVYNPNLFNTCNHAVFTLPNQPPGVTLELYDFKINDNVMLWTLSARDYGQYNGFNFVFAAWHLNNVMAISAVCQQGNPAQAVSRLTGHILDRIG